MNLTSISEDKFKDLVKVAIIEVLEQRKDLVRDLFEEALEDIALAKAIEEGEQTKMVSRDHIIGILQGAR
jgi:hypothetical protein